MDFLKSFFEGLNPLSSDSFGSLLKKIAKIYAVFAIANSFAKVYYVLYNMLKVKRLWKNVPGKDMDLLARALRAKGNKFHDYGMESSLQYPDADIIKLDSPMPALLFNSPDALQWLLKDQFENITKTGAREDYLFALLREFLGKNGIFVLRHGTANPHDNDMWLKERKVSSLIFTKANFENVMYDTFINKSHAFQRRISAEIEQNPNGKLDIQELFFSFTMDSIEKFFLGKEVNTVEGGMSDYAKTFDLAHQKMIKHYFEDMPIGILIHSILPFPFGTLSTLGNDANTIAGIAMRGLKSDVITFKSAVANLNDQVLGYVRATRADPNIKSRKDIIANFLNSKIGDELTDEMLKDIVLNLTIAGRDTTACALSWMVFELTKSPEAQELLCDEIDQKLKGRDPTMKDIEIENMPYLHGVIYEALRLHPSVPTNQKMNDVDLVYTDGTVIPAKTLLLFSTLGMNRNPKRYPNPDKFDPERWIPFKQPSLFEFPVFQAGPRFCLGKDMAQFEMKILTCMLFQKFSFTLLPGELENIRYTPMLTPSVSNDPNAEHQHLWVIPKARFQ